MENKLKMELDAMPGPVTSFGELEAKARRPGGVRVRRKTIMVLAAVLVVLLCGAGWAKMQYGMWLVYSSRDWNDLQESLEKYDLILPETLDGIPFLDYSQWGHVPQGASHMEALLNPAYKSVDVEYAVEVLEIETYPGGEKMSETYARSDELSLNFGTTENELWRYYFQFDENGFWTACEVPESYETIEYRGITLQVGDTVYYDSYRECDIYTRWVHWVDEEKQIVVSISETDYTDPERVVKCAKEIIDLNS